ncbi:MAG: 23S rRNA (guanosine(2251)-2'-O)-methyltransferase RlmB [Chloroflexi bacterium]|nr:23S rRNA (guanosine(2251)-2'-O)-methyltransferase RlmB [Chloroflexota bacterium]
MKEYIYGRHPVFELLKAGRRRVVRILLAEGAQRKGIFDEIVKTAEKLNIPMEIRARAALDKLRDHNQGILAQTNSYPYADWDQIIEKIETSASPGIVLLLDVIQDPQNLGTLLRTAEAVGVHGIILPARQGVGVTPAVVKSSSGASEHLLISKHNLAQSIKQLQKHGLWIIGLENTPQSTALGEFDSSGAVGIVVGGEERGLRKLVRDSCDYLVRLPMQGKLSSLNAATAGSVMLYSIWMNQNRSSFSPSK